MHFIEHIKWTKEILFSSLEAVVLFFQELSSFIALKRRVPRDKEALAMAIRKRGHHVEKYVLVKPLYDALPDAGLWAKQLEEYVKIWDQKYKTNTPDIQWARRMVEEYKNSATKGEGCIVRSKLMGGTVKTIQDAIYQRQSFRVFKDTPVEKEKILQLIKAAQHAPNSCNRQTLSYIAIDNPVIKETVAKTIPGGDPFARKAPLLLMVLADKREYRFPQERFTPYQDAAAAIQNILLLTKSLELGACWCSYVSYSGIKEEKKIRKLLFIPELSLICGIIVIGYPAQFVCPVLRRPAQEVLFKDTMGNPFEYKPTGTGNLNPKKEA